MVIVAYVFAWFALGFVCAVVERIYVHPATRAPAELWVLCWPLALLVYASFWVSEKDPVGKCADAIKRLTGRTDGRH